MCFENKALFDVFFFIIANVFLFVGLLTNSLGRIPSTIKNKTLLYKIGKQANKQALLLLR